MLLPSTWQSHLSWLLFIIYITTIQVRAQDDQQPQQPQQCDPPPNSIPTNYSDFSAILIQQRIYLTGGNMDETNIWTLDISQGLNIQCPVWNPQETSSEVAIEPYSDGIAFAGLEGQIYVQAGDGGTVDMDNMVLYNTSSTTWVNAPVNISGPLPESRAQMSATMDTTSGIAWFYGGRATEAKQAAGESAYYNDFYSFNTQTSTWDWPPVRYAWGQRPARYGHTSSIIGNQIFILGGKTAVVNASGDTWVTYPADFQSVLVFDTDGQKAVTMATIGDTPDGKVGFSAALAPDGHSIVVFGGQDTVTGQSSQDVYLLDTCTLQWSNPGITGTPPSPRSGHQAVTYDHYMLILMGYNNESAGEFASDIGILDMSTWQWIDNLPAIQESINAASKPECRFTMPHMPDSNGNGGGDGNSGLPYDPTVISNPNQSSDNSTQVALGVSFGVGGFLLIMGALVFYIRKLRKDAHTPSPRWLPDVLKKETQLPTPLPPPAVPAAAAKPPLSLASTASSSSPSLSNINNSSTTTTIKPNNNNNISMENYNSNPTENPIDRV
ncbi:hypothetical protein BDA99DRAFT_531688 [Phascolomyces articulosus]|uniref:Galactose oxidase n=1 Tax=Phascolomyces articulosus TaxID=60185 RepID=A0AAD5KCV4_9FUNG|nr:hypothetical protein BDA99DRAFT_531688 [Phascolomyces articulosus]